MDLIIVLGLTAAAFTSFGSLPQLIKSIKLKETKDISLWMYILFCIGVSLWLIYGIIKKDFPIIIANCVSLVIFLWILVLKIMYG